MGDICPDWRERQRAERGFYDARTVPEAPGDLRVAPTLSDKSAGMGYTWLRRCCGIDTPADLRVLDCGCGTGISSIIWSQHGARVFGFDISMRCVEMTRERARANRPTGPLSLLVSAFEELPFQASSFDIVFGMRVLHHVEVARAAREAYRVLKPGGKAIFWEPLDLNPIVRFFRRHARRLGVAKVGTRDEHPLARRELDGLRDIFGGRLRIHHTGFLFFTLLDRNVLRHRFRLLSRLLAFLDRMTGLLIPPLRRYSHVHLLELTK